MDKKPIDPIEYEDREPEPITIHARVLHLATVLAFIVTPIGLAAVLGAAVVHARLAKEDVASALERPGVETVVSPEPAVASDPVLALRDAQDRVKHLETELAERTDEVAKLRAAGESAESARVIALTDEVATLERSVARARRDRESLRTSLATALADLDREVIGHATTQRRADAFARANTENLWAAFTERTKIDVCRQITEGGRVSCREKLDAWFDEDRHDRFASCVDGGQSMPTLWKRSGQNPMPSTAEPVGVHDFGQRQNWFVVYCDPTLPEAQVAEEDAEPSPALFTASRR